MQSILGEIKLWALAYAPKDWHLCDGSMLQIQSNTALYSLLGTAYGGNGTTTFALPDLRGRVPVGTGVNNGIQYQRGVQAGVENVTLTQPNMPPHTHGVHACSGNGNGNGGLNRHIAAPVTQVAPITNVNLYAPAGGPTVALAPASVSTEGGSAPHNNMQPYLALNYYICTTGVYPQRP